MTQTEAERAIAAILRDLEATTDCVVERIEIHDTEVTNMEDDRRQFVRVVSIVLRRLPGQRWAP